MAVEYNNNHSNQYSSILIIGLVVVLILLFNITTTTTVLAGRWMIHDHDHPNHHQENEQHQQLRGGGGDPTTTTRTRTRFFVPDDELVQEPKMLQLHLDPNTLRRVIDSLNAELIRSGEPAEFVLRPLTRGGGGGGDRENFRLHLRPLHQKIGRYRRMDLSDDFPRREAANTGPPIFRFRSDPDWKKQQQQQQKALPESRGGGTRIGVIN